MGDPLTLALSADGDPDAPLLSEPWVEPAQLADCSRPEAVDLESVCSVASDLLFLLSGRKFGVRTETVRPHQGARWCGWDQSNGPFDCLALRSPIRRIYEVKIDGITLDAADYRIYDDRRLVRVPGDPHSRAVWPLQQRLDLDDDQTNTFSVRYAWGRDVPEPGKVAAQVFACQLAKYVNRDSDCQLPTLTTAVTRRGVSQTLDPQGFLDKGRTGLYLVDLWLSAVNPKGSRRRPVFASPDDVQMMRPA